jgi:DNA-binding transcriptional LysR family regulator
MDQLQSMRAFAMVVQEGSFARAARALSVAPPAITRWVADLETHLGVRLLTRSSRSLVLTSAGERFLERVRTILADLDDAEAEAGSVSVVPSGRVRLLSTQLFSFHQLVPRLPAFHNQYPEIKLDLTNASSVYDLLDESCDISLLLARGELRDADFVAQRLFDTHIVLCAAPAYAAERGLPSEPSGLASHRTFTLQAFPTWNLSRATSADRLDSPHTPGGVVRADAITLYAAVLQGVGIMALPTFAVAADFVSGRLVPVLPQWTADKMTLYAAMPTRKHIPARTRVLLDFLLKTFRADGDPWMGTSTVALGGHLLHQLRVIA